MERLARKGKLDDPLFWELLPKMTEREMVQILANASTQYYSSGISFLTDEQYDLIQERLREVSPDAEILEQIGAPEIGEKVALPYHMGSMCKRKNEAEINRWITKYPGSYVVSDKMDGISCLQVQEHGRITLYTRGNGDLGRDITHIWPLIDGCRKKTGLSKNKRVVRGELVISRANHAKHPEFKTPLSMVVSVVNTMDFEKIDLAHAKLVQFVAFEQVYPTVIPSQQMQQLEQSGYHVVTHWERDQIDLEYLSELFQLRRVKSKYPVDGVIVSHDAKYQLPKSGNPSYSFAYKGMLDFQDTRVTFVEWRPTKDGRLQPRIHFDPIALGGTEVKKTSGFNAAFITSSKIGEGALIRMIKSGNTIPHIVAILKPARKSGKPDRTSSYRWDSNKVHYLLDAPESNTAVIARRLLHFSTKLQVDGISVGIVNQLVQAGYGSCLQFIQLTYQDLLALDRFADKKARKLWNNLQDALEQANVLDLMVASNLLGTGMGRRRITLVLDQYPTIVEQYRPKMRQEWFDCLLSLDGFQEITANVFLDNLPRFQAFLKAYRKIRPIPDYQPDDASSESVGDQFQDQVIVFSGKRHPDWEEKIQKEGGIVGKAVTGKTTMIVVDGAMQGKVQKALARGIPVLTAQEFQAQYLA